MMRHREAWAVEKRAPSKEKWESMQQEESTASPTKNTSTATGNIRRRKVAATPQSPSTNNGSTSVPLIEEQLPKDILIVVSKLKKYVKARSGFKTSDGIMEALSDHVRKICDEAIRNAGRAERKTILERDIPSLYK